MHTTTAGLFTLGEIRTASDLTSDGNLLINGNATTTGSQYIGNDLTVMNGNVGISTTSPSTTFSVTGNGYFTGGLGVGVVNATANSFQVGQCVTGNTLFKSAGRRKKKERWYLWIYLWWSKIKNIKQGDEILTLDEKTGETVWKKVKKLAYMGKKPIIEITTVSGKKLEPLAIIHILPELINQKLRSQR